MLTSVQRVECIWAIYREADRRRNDPNVRKVIGRLLDMLEDLAELPHLFISINPTNICDIELLRLVRIIAPHVGPPSRGSAAEILQRHLLDDLYRFKLVTYEDSRRLATIWIVPLARSRHNPLTAFRK